MKSSEIQQNHDKIIADNIKMHNANGYAEFYDNTLGLIKNNWERKIFLSHLNEIISELKQQNENDPIYAIDLGAGTGNLTLELLKHNINVTAIDISQKMLSRLKHNVQSDISIPQQAKQNLDIICQPVDAFLQELSEHNKTFHLACACSFLHHLPDYLHTIKNACKIIKQTGFIYFAHEPMHKTSISHISRVMQKLDFKLWRLNVHIEKLTNRAEQDIDRYYDPDSYADFWDTTTGCDQNKILNLLNSQGFDAKLIEYDSKRSKMLHNLCLILKTKTLFAIRAKKR